MVVVVDLEALEIVEAASEELLENVAGFLAPNPILSSSDDPSIVGIEAFRKRPDVEARGFNGRDANVWLPGLRGGRFFTGLGVLSRGEGNLEAVLLLCELDGVWKDLAVVGRLPGVLTWVEGCRKVFVDARKSAGKDLSSSELVGLLPNERPGGPMEES